MEARLWSHFALAGQAFAADPSPRNEGIFIAAYAAWVREFCPHDADELIDFLCKRTAGLITERVP